MDLKSLKDNLKQELFIANTHVPDDYRSFLKNKIDKAEDSKERFFLRKLIQNARIAEKNEWPLCQDTGFITFYIDFPGSFSDFSQLKDVCTEAVSECYTENEFRASMLDVHGNNTNDNTPCFFHLEPWERDYLRIRFLVKGGGSENVSQLITMLPSDDDDTVIERIYEVFSANISDKACPPYFIGVCIGGSVERAVTLSRVALLDMDFSAEQGFDLKLKQKLNSSLKGIFGTGYGDTVFHLRTVRESSHIATKIVSICVNCHSFRRGEVITEI